MVISRALKGADDILIKSPLDLKNVASLSIFLIAILIVINVAQLFTGELGSLIVSFLTGLFELHGLSLANAVMHRENKILIQDALLNITVAMCASFVAKAIIVTAIARGKFSIFMFTLALVMSTACLLAWCLAAN